MDKELRLEKQIERDNVKSPENKTEDYQETIVASKSNFGCDRCKYKCTRLETSEKHIDQKHKHKMNKERVWRNCDSR